MKIPNNEQKVSALKLLEETKKHLSCLEGYSFFITEEEIRELLLLRDKIISFLSKEKM